MSIDYVRTGRGDTVVVLHGGDDDDAAIERLIEQLALDHRVIVPALASDDSLPGALDNLLEGLGMCCVALVAAGEFARLAQEFIADRPGRVSSLVTL